MKSKIILTSILALGIIIIISSFQTNEKKIKYLTMRVLEGGTSKIVVSDEDGNNLEYELESGFRASPLSNNTSKINEIFNKIAAKNYELISSDGTGGDIGHVSTYVFVKKD